MKRTTTSLILAVLSIAATAAADEPRLETARRAGILSVMEGPRERSSYVAPAAATTRAPTADGPAMFVPGLCGAGRACDARGTVSWARPLFRSVGACGADALAELASEIGRLQAIEQCTGHGEIGATARPLRRPAPASAFASAYDVESDPLAGLDL